MKRRPEKGARPRPLATKQRTLRAEILEPRLPMDATATPFFLFTASTRLSDDSTIHEIGPTAAITNHTLSTNVVEPPPTGTATGALSFSLSAESVGNRQFEIEIETSASYSGEGTGLAKFGIAEFAYVEIDVYARTSERGRSSLVGTVTTNKQIDGVRVDCMLRPVEGCGEVAAGAISPFQAFDVGRHPGPAVPDGEGVFPLKLALGSDATIEYEGIEYQRLGNARTSSRVDWGQNDTFGFQGGDHSIDADAVASISIQGEVPGLPPIAKFENLSPDPSSFLEPTRLSARESLDLDNSPGEGNGIINYEWTAKMLERGLPAGAEIHLGNGEEIEALFPEPGTYQVELKVTDDEGDSATTHHDVETILDIVTVLTHGHLFENAAASSHSTLEEYASRLTDFASEHLPNPSGFTALVHHWDSQSYFSAAFRSELTHSAIWHVRKAVLVAASRAPNPAALSALAALKAMELAASQLSKHFQLEAAKIADEAASLVAERVSQSATNHTAIHLIGQGRGGYVMSRAAQLLQQRGQDVCYLTLLDGHGPDWHGVPGRIADGELGAAFMNGNNFRVSDSSSEYWANRYSVELFNILSRLPIGPASAKRVLELLNRIGTGLDWRAPERSQFDDNSFVNGVNSIPSNHGTVESLFYGNPDAGLLPRTSLLLKSPIGEPAKCRPAGNSPEPEGEQAPSVSDESGLHRFDNSFLSSVAQIRTTMIDGLGLLNDPDQDVLIALAQTMLLENDIELAIFGSDKVFVQSDEIGTALVMNNQAQVILPEKFSGNAFLFLDLDSNTPLQGSFDIHVGERLIQNLTIEDASDLISIGQLEQSDRVSVTYLGDEPALIKNLFLTSSENPILVTSNEYFLEAGQPNYVPIQVGSGGQTLSFFRESNGQDGFQSNDEALNSSVLNDSSITLELTPPMGRSVQDVYVVNTSQELIRELNFQSRPIFASRQNQSNPSDVNRDGVTSALDALVIINLIGRGVSNSFESVTDILPDVTGDELISARDALVVINDIARSNRESSALLGEQIKCQEKDCLLFDEAITLLF